MLQTAFEKQLVLFLKNAKMKSMTVNFIPDGWSGEVFFPLLFSIFQLWRKLTASANCSIKYFNGSSMDFCWFRGRYLLRRYIFLQWNMGQSNQLSQWRSKCGNCWNIYGQLTIAAPNYDFSSFALSCLNLAPADTWFPDCFSSRSLEQGHLTQTDFGRPLKPSRVLD